MAAVAFYSTSNLIAKVYIDIIKTYNALRIRVRLEVR